MTKKIIITGGCGYIGSHVAQTFKQNGDKVYIIDRVYREHTLRNCDSFMISDVVSNDALSLISKLEPDIIVHCAGTSLVGPSVIDPSDYYENNVGKTIKLLNHIKDMVKKPNIIFSSSASVYGNPEDIPIKETHQLNPISPYGQTKVIIETLLRDYSKAYSINSVSFRYFNASGADVNLGQEPEATHIIAKALEASISGRTFTLYGDDYNTPDGTCIRDYIHVLDLAIAHIKASSYLEKNPGCHIFNLGTNKGTSNQEIINYIGQKYGFKFLAHGNRRYGDPSELVADSNKANIELNWKPIYSEIETIIDSAYNWYIKTVDIKT